MLENEILLEYYHIERIDQDPLFSFNHHDYYFTYCPYEEDQLYSLYTHYLSVLSTIKKQGFKLILNQYQQILSCHYVLFEIIEEEFTYNDLLQLNKRFYQLMTLDMKKEVNRMKYQINEIRKQIENIEIKFNEDAYMITMYHLGLAENCLSLLHTRLKENQPFLIRQSLGHNDLSQFNYPTLFNPLNILYKPIIHDLACFYKKNYISLKECIYTIEDLEFNVDERIYLFLFVCYPYEFFNELETQNYKIDFIHTKIEDLNYLQHQIKDLYRYLSKYIPNITFEWMLK